jgi:hypothetical protein
VNRLRSLAIATLGIGSLAAESIHLKTRELQPFGGPRDYVSSALKRRTEGRSHYVIQFDKPVSAEHFDQLRRRGITVTGYLPDSAVVASAPDDFDVAGMEVRWVGRLEHRDKISPLIEANRRVIAYAVEFHPDVDMNEARAMVREHNLRIVENRALSARHLLVAGAFGDISRLASWDEVAYVFPASRDLLAGTAVRACAGAIVQQTTVPQYAAIIQGWPVGSPAGITLGYVFSQLTDQLPAATTRTEILKAFDEWTKYVKITLAAGGNPQARRTVNILFARGSHGDTYSFDGPGKVLAHTFYPAPPNPEPIAGDMHLDADERWQVGANTDLFSVVLHEIGHALGLGHSDNPGSVMYPYYRFGARLSNEDVANIRFLYPARDAALPDTPAPPPPAPFGLVIQTPVQASVTTASALAISGMAMNGVGTVRVTWQSDSNRFGTALGSASWVIPSVPLNVGKNIITITAVDGAKRMVSQTLSITRQQLPSTQPAPTPAPPPPAPAPPPPPAAPGGDLASPSLTITYPGSTIFSTTSGTVSFQGMAIDNVGVSFVTWMNSTGTSGSATGAITWRAPDIPLRLGNNLITIKAFDAAGNFAWRSVMVVRR